MTTGSAAVRLRVDSTTMQRLCRQRLVRAKAVLHKRGDRRFWSWDVDASDLKAFQGEIRKVGTRAAYAARRKAVGRRTGAAHHGAGLLARRPKPRTR
jgi:hypothetical protein